MLTFAYDSSGRLRPERGERWDAAERALVHDLRENGWIDAFRALTATPTLERAGHSRDDRGGWRLDHVLVHGLEPSPAPTPTSGAAAGLSDHSALVADLV